MALDTRLRREQNVQRIRSGVHKLIGELAYRPDDKHYRSRREVNLVVQTEATRLR